MCISWGGHTCPCVYMWRTEKDTKYLLSPFTLLCAGRVSHCTRSSPFSLGWPASKLLGLPDSVSDYSGYRYTWPCPAFMRGCWGFELRFSCLSSSSYPWHHGPSPCTHFFLERVFGLKHQCNLNNHNFHYLWFLFLFRYLTVKNILNLPNLYFSQIFNFEGIFSCYKSRCLFNVEM